MLETTDAAKSFSLYQRASALHHIPSMLKEAAFYEIGKENAPTIPVSQDRKKAFKMYAIPYDEFFTMSTGFMMCRSGAKCFRNLVAI
jgi:hypothetical protein